MQILMNPSKAGPCVLVLGMFDGVHRGHQALLMRGLEVAEEKKVPLCVCTFEPHPLAVLAPEHAPLRLTTPDERIRLMDGYGVDLLCVHTFTRELAGIEPEAFLQDMEDVYAPKTVICGFNYTFGARGRGNGEMLTERGRRQGYQVEIIDEVKLLGDVVSSTRIRRVLEMGDIPKVNRLLGHAYTISGKVLGESTEEDGLRILPLSADGGKALPCRGVYLCYILASGAGRIRKGLVSIGGKDAGMVEVCPLDGRDMTDDIGDAELQLLDCIRPGETFSGQDAMEEDREAARRWFEHR
ncbi:MAG: riboflavin biosynthesis protein RibF [Clostridia bacterium]|nr:riboflavin biosynthesis protein RibF [Clostridia bacterium]